MTVDLSKFKGACLKEKVKRDKLIPYKCKGTDCGIVRTWKGKTLVLALDHINGNNRDNRLENLRFLCPNCHSQTDTFCGKNAKRYSAKNKKVSDEDLITALKKNKSIAEALRSCKLSGATNYIRAHRLILENSIYMQSLDKSIMEGVCNHCKK